MSALKQPLPQRKPAYRFALTPLADAMFQLLIFFMLSTSLTPYSLITLRSNADAPTEEAAAPGSAVDETAQPDGSAAEDGRIRIWTLGFEVVTTAGATYEPEQLRDLAEAVSEQRDVGPVILIVTATARMQDVAAAMEALRSADIADVQITTENGV